MFLIISVFYDFEFCHFVLVSIFLWILAIFPIVWMIFVSMFLCLILHPSSTSISFNVFYSQRHRNGPSIKLLYLHLLLRFLLFSYSIPVHTTFFSFHFVMFAFKLYLLLNFNQRLVIIKLLRKLLQCFESHCFFF